MEKELIKQLLKDKFILDACCGPRFMWFDKKHPNTLYIDNRKEEKGFVKARPNCEINPDLIADFRDLPFPNKSFKLIVWDPPHIFRKCFHPKHDITKKYGILNKETWKDDYIRGFRALWRVLEDHGILIFKLNNNSVPFSSVLKLFPINPLFGNRVSNNKNSSTKWFTFMKIPESKNEKENN